MNENVKGSTETHNVKREHVESPDCWCSPTLDFVAENGNKVWVHHEPN